MKKIILLFAALGSLQLATAQTSIDYDTEAEMQLEMQQIVNTLGLDVMGTVELGNIMNTRREAKNELLKEMNRLKTEMTKLDVQAEQDLKSMLTPEQWKQYVEQIKPAIDADLKTKQEKIK